jgi:hypothetical protein
MLRIVADVNCQATNQRQKKSIEQAKNVQNQVYGNISVKKKAKAPEFPSQKLKLSHPAEHAAQSDVHL